MSSVILKPWYLCFMAPVIVYASPENPGARALVAELKQRYQGLRITEEMPDDISCEELKATHFLLYLNADTFVGDSGMQLADQVRKVRAAKMPIVMVHENDQQRGGCAFERICRVTASDLINDGLYTALAIAAYPGDNHRAISLALIAKALGAVIPERLSLFHASKCTIRRVSELSSTVADLSELSSRSFSLKLRDARWPRPSLRAARRQNMVNC